MPKHQGFYRPLHPSKYKGTLPITYRSYPELKICRFCDASRHIVEWGSESVVIPYRKPTDGRVHRYFVDYYFVFIHKGVIEKYLIEYKPYRQTIPPVAGKRKRAKTVLYEQLTYAVNQAKWEAATAYAKERGWKFVVFTEKELGLD